MKIAYLFQLFICLTGLKAETPSVSLCRKYRQSTTLQSSEFTITCLSLMRICSVNVSFYSRGSGMTCSLDKEVNTNCFKYKEKVESSCRYKRHCTIKVNEGCSKMPSSGTFNHVNITWICINAINYQDCEDFLSSEGDCFSTTSDRLATLANNVFYNRTQSPSDPTLSAPSTIGISFGIIVVFVVVAISTIFCFKRRYYSNISNNNEQVHNPEESTIYSSIDGRPNLKAKHVKFDVRNEKACSSTMSANVLYNSSHSYTNGSTAQIKCDTQEPTANNKSSRLMMVNTMHDCSQTQLQTGSAQHRERNDSHKMETSNHTYETII